MRKPYNLKVKYILTESFLIEEYVKNNLSAVEISKKLNCESTTIYNYMKRYNIKRRTQSEANMGKQKYNKNAVKHGETIKKHYCKICNIQKISYQTWRYGQGMCSSCSNKGKRNASYIDGRTPLTKSIRHLSENNRFIKLTFKRDNYTCQECEQVGGKLEAHHKLEFHIILAEFLKEYGKFSPIEDKETLAKLATKYKAFWNIDNGITLCKECHKSKHPSYNLRKN